MYMSEISKFKISDLKPQKMTILWTLKHVSAISNHPVLQRDTDFVAIFTCPTVAFLDLILDHVQVYFTIDTCLPCRCRCDFIFCIFLILVKTEI